MLPLSLTRQIEAKLASLEELLEPLEAGQMRMGSKSRKDDWKDETQKLADHYSSTINIYRAILNFDRFANSETASTKVDVVAECQKAFEDG